MADRDVPVFWWSNRPEIHPAEQWDSGMLHDLFENQQWRTNYEFDQYVSGETPGDSRVPPPGIKRAVVVVAARHHVEDTQAINHFIGELDGVLLILLGDEEAVFPWQEIVHPNIRFWVMMPHPIKHAGMVPWAYFFGTGYKHDTMEILARPVPAKDTAWCFAGQVTHERRKQAVNGLTRAQQRVAGALEPSLGFTRGLPRAGYLNMLAVSKIAPCPSGPVTADTMRLYEALEAGCLPIVDGGPEGAPAGFWETTYGDDHPLIVTNDWGSVGGIIEAETSPQRWPLNANTIGAWWMLQKRHMAQRLVTDLQQIGVGEPALDALDKVTVIITVSPIPSHPSMEILDHTMQSIADSLGDDVRLIIACDGVRAEQRDMAPAYHEFVRNLVWRCNHKWTNVLPIVSKKHRHQAGMFKLALAEVTTPTILFVEHDTPFSLEPDEWIDWEPCIELVAYRAVDILRFHHEAQIHPEHVHLSLDPRPVEMLGVPLVRTVQYSARPHLASTAYYREVMERFFPEGANCFIEDKMHGVAVSDRTIRHAIAIYHPEGRSIRRTLHTDGRANGPKYDDQQVFG